MEVRVSLREANQHLSRYVKAVEAGDVIVITRRGEPVARLVAEPAVRSLTPVQEDARRRSRVRMARGYPLGGEPVERDALHER